MRSMSRVSKSSASDDEDVEGKEKPERKLKGFKECVQFAIMDSRSQKLMASIAQRREVVPNV